MKNEGKRLLLDQDLIEGDGTKSHGLGGKKNEVNVILGKNQETGEKALLGLGVNEDWKETAVQFKGKAEVAVSDNEPSLRNALWRRQRIIRLVFVTVWVMCAFTCGMQTCQKSREKKLQTSS